MTNMTKSYKQMPEGTTMRHGTSDTRSLRCEVNLITIMSCISWLKYSDLTSYTLRCEWREAEGDTINPVKPLIYIDRPMVISLINTVHQATSTILYTFGMISNSKLSALLVDATETAELKATQKHTHNGKTCRQHLTDPRKRLLI